MPLTSLQTQVFRALAARRTPESYVAGATPLNRDGMRYSHDIDIFHDLEERVRLSAEADTQALAEAGFSVEWLRQFPAFQSARVARDGQETQIEWVADSDYRFFPTVSDETFGYMLHPIDLAMNKAMAAAGRRALRDIVDLVTIHRTILPLGAVIWAAVDKAPGFTPEGMIAEIRRNSNYPRSDWNALESAEPLDPKVVMPQLLSYLAEAEAFVLQMPTAKAGLLFLEDGKVVQPDPTRLDHYQTYAAQRRGHWPSSPEIAHAMFERILESGATE